VAADVIRDLLVRFGIVVKPATKQGLRDLDRQIEATKASMEGLASFALRLGRGLATGIAAGVGVISSLAVSTGAHATEVERQAAALNLTRREYQEYLYVTETLGGKANDLADTLLQVNEASVRAQEGSKEMSETFGLIGIRVEDLRGLRPGQLFERIADAVSTTADKQKALAAVSRLLGEEAARRFGPAMMKGAAGIRAMRQEAEDLGVVMTDDQLRASIAVADQWRKIRGVAKGLRNEIGAALAPAVLRLTRGLLDWVRANRELLSQRIDTWARRIDAAIETVQALVKALGGWDVALVNLATGAGFFLVLLNLEKLIVLATNARIAWGFLKGVLVAAGFTGAAAFTPVVLILGTILGMLGILYLIADDIITFFRGGNSILGDSLDRLERFIPVVGDIRFLVAALGRFFLGAATNAWTLASAVGEGLAGAFSRLWDALLPIRTILDQIWSRINAIAGTPFRWLGTALDSMTATAGNNAGVVAGQIRSSVAGSVQGTVEDTRRWSEGAARSIDSTVHQNNWITTHGPIDLERAFESANRKASPVVKGGPR
jgi:hypothetical protein